MSDNSVLDAQSAKGADVRVGQLWRDETDRYLYLIVAVQGDWIFGRHPNAKQGAFQIRRAWFSEPHWTLVRDVNQQPRTEEK